MSSSGRRYEEIARYGQGCRSGLEQRTLRRSLRRTQMCSAEGTQDAQHLHAFNGRENIRQNVYLLVRT